jgi:hypothetical protein
LDEYVKDMKCDDNEDVYDDEEQHRLGSDDCILRLTRHFHQFTSSDRNCKKQNKALHINMDSSSVIIFILYFASVTDLLVTDM